MPLCRILTVEAHGPFDAKKAGTGRRHDA